MGITIYPSEIKVATGLAADLTFPSSLKASSPLVEVLGINATASLTTILSLTGKYHIGYLSFMNIAVENITIKLTIDDVVIWNDTYANPGTSIYLLAEITAAGIKSPGFVCKSSFLLELQTTADSSIDFYYLVRPIR